MIYANLYKNSATGKLFLGVKSKTKASCDLISIRRRSTLDILVRVAVLSFKTVVLYDATDNQLLKGSEL